MPAIDIFAPVLGMRRNAAPDEIDPREMADCLNVIIYSGRVQSRPGYAQIGARLSGAIVGVQEYDLFSGTKFLLVWTVDDVYKWDAAGAEWDSLTNATLTGADSNLVYADIVYKGTEADQWIVFTNGVDAVQYWDGAGLTVATLGGSPPVAKFLVNFKDYCLLMHTIEGGDTIAQRVRWPDTGDPTNWTTGNANYVDLRGSDKITGGLVFGKGDYLAALKERSIWLGYLTGDSDIFYFESKAQGAGCVAGKSAQAIPDGFICLAHDGVYRFDGITHVPISGKIQRDLISRMNPATRSRAWGITLSAFNQYWLFVPGAGDTYPAKLWCYNYEMDAWTYGETAHGLTSGGAFVLQAGESQAYCDEATTYCDEDPRYCDEGGSSAEASVYVYGDSNGDTYRQNPDVPVYTDDGTAIDSWFETKDFAFAQLAVRQFMNRQDVYFEGASLEVQVSTDGGATWIPDATLTSGDEDIASQLWHKHDAVKVRYRYRNTGGQYFKFRRAKEWAEASGSKLA